MKNKPFKCYKQNLLLLAFVALMSIGTTEVFAQTVVTGKVSDATGVLPGVNVIVQGTTIGEVTDFDGNYSINVPQGENVLVFSYIGYQKQSIAVAGKSTVNVTMVEDAEALSEVVVVGYGTQRKADLTGAIGSIGANEIVSKPITSPDQALAGTISGVNITNRSGDPGAPISVLIRGVGTAGRTEPLWVIDGVPLVQTTNISVNTSSTTDSNPLAGLNSNDIESIYVLKDAASTAIYGSRAANGVIIVTTKRGKSGAARVTYDGYISSATSRDRINVLNVEQFIDIQGQLGRDVSEFAGSEFVDWQDLIFQTGLVQNHNVSVSGGNENANYFISSGYLDQEGIELAQGFSRFSFKANSDIKVGKRLKFGESILISQTDRQIQSEPAIFAGFNSALNAPYFQPFGNGAFGYNDILPETVGNGISATNYLFNTDSRFTTTKVQNRKLLANFYGELEILSGLKLRPSLGIDYNVGVGDYFTSDAVLNNSTGFSLLVSERPVELTLTAATTLQYDKTFGDHNIGVLVGFEQTKFRFDTQRIQGRDLFNDNLAGTGTTVAASSGADQETLQGWLGRLNYNYKGRYLATFNMRRDATSRFAPENRVDVFPSISVGWRISDESFFPEESVFNDIKVRAGWGQSGNQASPNNFPYVSAIDNNIRYVIGDGQETVLAPAPTLFANRALVWEISTQYGIGVDFSMFENKLTGTFDYYNKVNDGVLIGLPLPYVSGFFLDPDANIGSIENSGIELSLNYSGQSGDFKYAIGGNFTTNKNEVKDLGDITQIISGIGGTQTHRTTAGQSLGHFFGYKTNGLYQNDAEVAAAVPDVNGTPSPGDIRFVDVNEDGVVDADDRTYLGNPFPGFYYGMNFNAEYKGLDFSINFRGVGDRQIYNSARTALEGLSGGNNFSTQVLNRWTGEGTANSSSNPRLSLNDPNGNNRYSDRWIEDAGYLRIQNIQVGYNLSQEFLSSWTNNTISNLRIYLGAQNLATFTKYSGYDPEVGRTQSFQQGEFTLATGQDGGASPLPRIVQFGLSVTFN
jgi:TonB-linked SusC/RagA family outer membrane protein